MMNRCIVLFVIALLSGAVAPARAYPTAAPPTPAPATPAPAATAPATPVPMPNAAEAKFVSSIRADLTQRFPTAADAEKAGYVRYTNEDDTGAISYANRQWTSVDAKHPSQLWYDVKGRLLGADYSVLKSASPKAPALWGVDPSRWDTFGAHVHYVLRNADGTMTYGRAIRATKYADAGGDPEHPTAEGLVKAGAVKSASAVSLVFLFPAIWDMTVWTLPNPAGAFADKNPNVKPSKAGGTSM
jgi:hypothetical protein